MARATERPAKTEQDIDQEDFWEVQGESPDSATRQALNLAHRAVGKFPELADRYRGYAGPVAVVSGALLALAGVAVARRARRGQQPDEILAGITSEEIENAATVTSRHNRWWRMILRIAKRRKDAGDASAGAS